MIFKPELATLVLDGLKTETRRKVKPGEECRYRPGRSYAVQDGRGKPARGRIEIVSVRRELLGEITDEAAVREGFEHRVPFFRYWGVLYGLKSVDMECEVWVIRFRQLRYDKPRRDEMNEDLDTVSKADFWAERRRLRLERDYEKQRKLLLDTYATWSRVLSPGFREMREAVLRVSRSPAFLDIAMYYGQYEDDLAEPEEEVFV